MKITLKTQYIHKENQHILKYILIYFNDNKYHQKKRAKFLGWHDKQFYSSFNNSSRALYSSEFGFLRLFDLRSSYYVYLFVHIEHISHSLATKRVTLKNILTRSDASQPLPNFFWQTLAISKLRVRWQRILWDRYLRDKAYELLVPQWCVARALTNDYFARFVCLLAIDRVVK